MSIMCLSIQYTYSNNVIVHTLLINWYSYHDIISEENHIRKVVNHETSKAPLVTSGLVLGLLGLGNLLKDLSLTLNAVCGIFAFLIWIHLLCTMIKYFNNVKEQLNSPLVSSVFTTFFMSGFLGTTYLNTFLVT